MIKSFNEQVYDDIKSGRETDIYCDGEYQFRDVLETLECVFPSMTWYYGEKPTEWPEVYEWSDAILIIEDNLISLEDTEDAQYYDYYTYDDLFKDMKPNITEKTFTNYDRLFA